MDCQVSLIYAHLALPGLDPDEVRDGQIVALLIALSRVAGNAFAIVGDLAAPLRATEIGRRAARPFLECLSKAGRVGEADAFGDHIYPHMGVLEEFGRQRSAHAIDD